MWSKRYNRGNRKANMLYNENSVPRYMDTAGKITLFTVFSGVIVFLLVFIFNVGKTEIDRVIAQSNTASTTLTVLNTPPQWIASTTEETESSTSTPTNSGDDMVWIATASDSNGAPYFLLVCAENVAPVASSAPDVGSLGTAPPSCATGVRQWAVSTSTVSGQQARAATTTSESFPPFAERNEWYSWVCDDDPVNPRCNNAATSTGITATNSSPFHVNRRPVFTDFNNDGPVDPAGTLVFLSTSSDPDTVGDTNGGEDVIYLVVCGTDSYSTTTNTCTSDFYASTTLQTVLSDASATDTVATIMQDQPYDAYGYIVDEHGHEASGGFQGTNVQFVVNNVAPTVAASSISIESGGPIILTVEQGETTGFTLEFTTSDANSCDSIITADVGDEVDDYIVSVYRSSVGSSTCDGTAGAYDANNCYSSGYTPWNLTCTAATSTCAGSSDATMDWDCTFPLWYIADPSDNGTYTGDRWRAAVSAVDDDNATGTFTQGTATNTLQSLTALALDTATIPYGALEPGNDSGTLSASTTVLATGNTGIDQNLSGTDMCDYFTGAVTCNAYSATSTIPALEQQYATSSVAYGSGASLSSSTPTEIELNVNKTTATATPAEGYTYWGINVPGTITKAGAYTGRNSFQAVLAEDADWVP